MAIKENNIWKRCLLRLGKIPGLRILRNNVGQAWTGRGFSLKAGQTYRAKGGERIIVDPRPVNFGLTKGSGDGIGWWSRPITEEMVGQRIAQFVSLETKSETGSAEPDQINWAARVEEAGGISIITKDPEKAAQRFEQLDWVEVTRK